MGHLDRQLPLGAGVEIADQHVSELEPGPTVAGVLEVTHDHEVHNATSDRATAPTEST